MLGFAVLIAETVGYSLLLRSLFGLPLLIGPIAYISATILTLYLSDFLHLLKPASVAIHLGGLFWLVVLCARTAPPPSISWRAGLRWTTAIVAAIALLAWISAINEKAEFHSSDEFTHWGFMIRSIYEANTFHFSASPLYFQDYTPGLALFSYHALLLLGYTEGNASLSYAFMVCCLIAPFLRPAIRLGPIWFLLVLAIALLSVAKYGHGLSTVLVDHVLSLYFAGTIAAYYAISGRERGRFVLPVMLGALTLTKNAQLFALIAAAICSFDTFILRYFSKPTDRADAISVQQRGRLWELARRRASRPFASTQLIAKLTPLYADFKTRMATVSAALRMTPRDIGWMSALFLAPIIVNATWKAHLYWSGLAIGWGSYSPLNSAARLIKCCHTDRETEAATKFFAQLFGAPAADATAGPLYRIAIEAFRHASFLQPLLDGKSVAPGIVMIAFVLVGAGAVWLVAGAKCKLRIAGLVGGLLAGSIGYNLALLVAYLYDYSDFEGRDQYTFPRFENVLVLSWLLLTVFLLTMVSANLARVRRYAMLIALGAVSYFWFRPSFDFIPAVRSAATLRRLVNENVPGKLPYRDGIREWTRKLNNEIPVDAKVYIAWPKGTEIEFWLTKFELIPRVTNLGCLSFELRRQPAAPAQCELSVTGLEQSLAGYDYLAIGRSTALVQSQYGALFNNTPSGLDAALFRIDRSGQGVKLNYVSELRSLCLKGAELRDISPPAGFAFHAASSAEFGPDDTTPERSRIIVCEDDYPLGPGHSNPDDIRLNGRGGYAHLPGYILFSTSDNSDPNTNGRKYRVMIDPRKTDRARS
jgi:hypothetical protein